MVQTGKARLRGVGTKGSVTTTDPMSIELRRLERERANQCPLSWGLVSEQVVRLADCVSARSGTVEVGGTRGGTGLVLKVWLDGERYTWYAGDAEWMVELLDAVCEALGA